MDSEDYNMDSEDYNMDSKDYNMDSKDYKMDSEDCDPSNSSTAENSLAKTTIKSRSTLRRLSQTSFRFLKDSLSEQWSLTVHDRKSNGDSRKLSKNELAAMTLNEIAVRHRRGFFLHLLSRKGSHQANSSSLNRWNTSSISTSAQSNKKTHHTGSRRHP